MRAMLHAKNQVSPRRSIGARLVCDHDPRRNALFREQFAHETLGCICIAPTLNKTIGATILIIDATPEPMY